MPGEYLYGRGTVDGNGQLYMLLAAARELARATSSVNVRFCCDGKKRAAATGIRECAASATPTLDETIVLARTITESPAA